MNTLFTADVVTPWRTCAGVLKYFNPSPVVVSVVILACSFFSSVCAGSTDYPFSLIYTSSLHFSRPLLNDRPTPYSRALQYSASDQSSAEKTDPEITGLFDRTHTIVSQRFSKFFDQIDDFFGQGQPAALINQSWARVRLDALKLPGENTELKGAIKLRVVLPRAQKRFRLLFSTDDNQSENNTSTENNQSRVAQDNGVSLALRFFRQAKKDGILNLDLGARYRDKRAQIFGRINFFFRHDLKWGFQSSFSNTFFLYSVSGYENKFRYGLNRAVNDRKTIFIRGATEIHLQNNRPGAIIGETIGLYSDISDKRAIAIEGLASYRTSLRAELGGVAHNEYFRGADFRVRFRHNIWRPWFYYEIWPTISWAPANDFKPSFGGMVRMEMILGKF